MRVSFRGEDFEVLEGATHPAYSLECFTSDEHEFREKHWNIKPGDIVVDAGASYGAYTLTAISQGAFVYAFEPEPSVFHGLYRNLQANGWFAHCGLYMAGLWDSETEADMREYAPHWPEQTISGRYPMKVLDSICDRKIDWLKVDVEGVEERVIRGALKTIERYRPRLIIEAHTFMDAQIPERIQSMLPGYKWEMAPREPCVMMVGRHA